MIFALLRHGRMRVHASAVVGALLVSGLAVVAAPTAPAASAAAPTPETFRVSQTDTGSSTEPFLTPDGQRVFFTSTASDLVGGDTNGDSDVFVSVAAPGSDDPFSGAAARVSVPDDALAAAEADGPSSQPVASADGRYVAFRSAATNLVAEGGTAGLTSIYVRDTLLGKTFRVQGAAAPDGPSYDPDLDDSGRHLVFTSEATNLTPGDTNGARDAFAADLDSNGDGIYGDVTLTRFLDQTAMAGGTEQARISGNGASVVFTAHRDSVTPPGTPGDYVYYGATPSIGLAASLVGSNAHSPTIDAVGDTFAYIDEDDCGGLPAIVAATSDANFYYAAAGTTETNRNVGSIADPVISGDGSRVTWTTTIPKFDPGSADATLDAPVIRIQEIGWNDSSLTIDCTGLIPDWTDLAVGSEASVSASARTVAFAAPTPAASTVYAIDTHRHAGLAVSSTQGQLATPGFMTRVDIPTIPLTSLRGYASAIANAPIHNLPIHNLPIHNLPIHNLPIHNLPIHNLPIHNLPIHNLPIHNLDFPGGWAQVLEGTPFAGELIQSVTLNEVLAWAEAALAPGSTATDVERAAAERIQSLTLGDLDVDGSALDSLTLASYVMGEAPVGDIALPGGTTWQSLVDAQGLGFQVDAAWYLADLDLAGLNIERSRIDAVALRSLPVGSSLMRFIDPSDLFLAGTPLGDLDVSTLDETARLALFGDPNVTGALAGFSQAFLPDATVADLAAGAPESVTFGDLLMSMLDRDSYPWEQIAPASIDPNLVEASTDPRGCDDKLRCGQIAAFKYTFDPGPGEPTTFRAPTATFSSPVGTSPFTTYVWGSGPDGSTAMFQPYTGPKQIDAEQMRLPLPDTAGGTVVAVKSYFTATTQPGDSHASGELTSGSLSASADLYGGAPLDSFDDPDRNLVDGQWVGNPAPLVEDQISYEWISPAWRDLDDNTGDKIQGPAQDEDYYLVNPPPAGKRLVVSTNATDGQISLSLYAPKRNESGLGVADAGPVPGTAVTEQTGATDQPAQAGADAGVPLSGQTLIDQTVVGGDGTAQIEAASTDAAPGDQLLVRVTSGNRLPSASLYSLRVQYLDEPAEAQCTAWTPRQTADPGVEGVSDPVTPTTNTIYLFDEKRYGDTYGAASARDVRDALVSLTGDGHVGDGAVDGAVLAIDSSPAVQAARASVDANPCSMKAREALSSAINAFVGQELGGNRSQIRSVVIVGGDDIIPLAPVAQHTSQFTEESHADDLRLPTLPNGDPCPAAVGVDPCETPLSAAARAAYILTDDPYGLAKAYESLGGHLYVPTVALGRLVEKPEQIEATIQRFLDADGRLTADSTLTGGYGAWSELPAQVTGSLAWRSAVNQQLPDPWYAADLQNRLFPADGDAPKVVSVNTHANETQMLPGVPGAETGAFGANDLFLAQGHEDASALAGSLIFGIGCHAGNNLPTSYYGDVTDWVDVFSQAGGYVGNTGYGLANNVTTALGERLLGLYADWIGVSVQGDQVSSGGALTYAKQSYLGGLGLYSGYDEKALMEAVYYGLPMYTVDDPAKTEMPLPPTPDLTPVTSGGITTASLSFQPKFAAEQDEQGRTYYTVDGNALAVPTAQGILPSILRVLEPQAGLVPRGVLLTSLTTKEQTGPPSLGQTTVGVPEDETTSRGSAFPSAFGTITHQDTPAGPVDLLALTPAIVQVTQDGRGSTELFTDFTAEVTYGPESSTDTTPPVVGSVDLTPPGGIEVRASDQDGDVASVMLLVQLQGSDAWQRLEGSKVVVRNPDGTVAETYWRVPTPAGPYRWMLQVVDSSGNVSTDTSRGHLDVAQAVAPTLGDAGPDASVDLGERLLRSVPITDAVDGERLTASTKVTDAAGDVVSSSSSTVEYGDDGTARALIDQPVTTPGSFTVTLRVCRGDACTSASFGVQTSPLNEAPTATVLLQSDANPVEPTSILTASARATDPDGDPVSAVFTWWRNGVQIPDRSESTLDLDGIAQTGDVVRVTVTPDDGKTQGHAASAEVLVGQAVVAPPGPQITAAATTISGPYTGGEWSQAAVTVTFECTSGTPVVTCPAPVVVSDDTPAAGLDVSGTMTDLLGRTATASVLVRVDATAPSLNPTVTPPTVAPGESAIATANATDASSGVASQSCDPPTTETEGERSVECRATDVSGNTATALAHYTVEIPAPEPPSITLTATNAPGAYVGGTWSRTPVTVTFTCTSGVAVTTCPAPRTVSSDTPVTGMLVAGMMEDALGRTATAQILVRIDTKAPALAPKLQPATIIAGSPGSATPNATDTGSGVATQSCDAVDSSKPGAKRLTCRATDVAGNTASVEIKYIVAPSQRRQTVPPIFGPQKPVRGGEGGGSNGGGGSDEGGGSEGNGRAGTADGTSFTPTFGVR
ncbi:hypothetical protein G5T42_06975 [Microbacterium sp. 4R-513]|uniref:PD40 domain-containing protein n=1 Tax=Microbacterium sp. 4R-513 TaxID=2567934 RepID=UPI0013E1EEFA|nr:PD40 domain-containing protein [Microbacterium sp. 4R-513]QIG39261.1 hypothetical protein G5T42_06975 [Microbacterium sp. 4R-513]